MSRLVVVSAFLALVAADWPQFRGPGGAGVAPDTPPPPTTWDKAKNVRWAVDVPGLGWGSPVAAGGRVFLPLAESDVQKRPDGPFGTTFPRDPNAKPLPPAPGMGFAGQPPPNAVYRWSVTCLDAATGKPVWTTKVAERKPATGTFGANGYASETPATDGERVYVAFEAAGVHCLDAATGKLVWSKDLGVFPRVGGFGGGSSPVLVGDLLVVLNDNETQSFVVALDKRTGEQKWRADRPGKSSWSSPFVWQTPGRTDLVCCGGKAVVAYDPATGAERWRLGGVDGGFNATPAADADRLYLGTTGPGTGDPLFAVRAGATGDITLAKGETSNTGVAWSRAKAGPYIASPVVYRGHLYVAGKKGTLSCYAAATGAPVYESERVGGLRSTTPSLWAADGKVYLLDEGGRTAVVKAGSAFELLAENPLGEMCWATPAVVGGRLYVRGRDKLYCIGAE